MQMLRRLIAFRLVFPPVAQCTLNPIGVQLTHCLFFESYDVYPLFMSVVPSCWLLYEEDSFF